VRITPGLFLTLEEQARCTGACGCYWFQKALVKASTKMLCGQRADSFASI